MKKTLFLIGFLSFIMGSAQIKKGKTTLEEYNYMTKGFKIQMESGLDMKIGYSTNKGQKITIGSYEFNYIKFYKNTLSDKIFVGYIVIAKSSSSGNSYTYAIPENNSELMTKTYVEINKLDEPMTTAFFGSYLLYKENIENSIL